MFTSAYENLEKAGYKRKGVAQRHTLAPYHHVHPPVSAYKQGRKRLTYFN